MEDIEEGIEVKTTLARISEIQLFKANLLKESLKLRMQNDNS